MRARLSHPGWVMRKASGEAVRVQIGQFIRTNPGVHFRAIQRTLQLSPGQAVHHLRRLVEDGLVVERRSARYTFYFPAGAVLGSRDAVAAVRQPVRCAVAREVQQAGARTLRELAEATGLATSTLHHHLRILMDSSVLEPEGPRPVRYKLTPDGVEALAVVGGNVLAAPLVPVEGVVAPAWPASPEPGNATMPPAV